MAWFGDGLSSLSNLKGQITSFTKEVLSEGIIEEIDEPTRKLNEANERCVKLQEILNSKDAEISLLRRQNCELEKAVVELNAKPGESDDGKSLDDDGGGGGFFWDPPTIKNRDHVNKNAERTSILQERLSQATLRIRELENELRISKTSSNELNDEINDDNRKTEFLRAKQDMVNRIIQIGEKSRDAEKNIKRQSQDETTLINDFRSALSKLDTQEKSHMIKSALRALQNGQFEESQINNEEMEKFDVDEKSEKFVRPRLESVSLLSNFDDSEIRNGIAENGNSTSESYREIENLRDRIRELQRDNEFLTTSLDELDKEHAQSLDAILVMKDQLVKKHESLQKAYEQLYVECNEAQRKLQMIENKSGLEANNNISENLISSSMKMSNEEKQVQTETSAIEKRTTTVQTMIPNIEDKKIQTERHDDKNDEVRSSRDALTERVREILKSSHIEPRENENVFEVLATNYVDANWKKEMLERRLTEMSREVKETSEIRDSLQMECDDMQTNIESLLMQIEHLKSNLPSIPEASEERVASLETETESMGEELKQLRSEHEALKSKHFELITVTSIVEGSLRNQENLEAELRNTRQQLSIAQQQLDGASKNVENNENMLEDLSRRLHASLEENNELRKRIENLEISEKRANERETMEKNCTKNDENLETLNKELSSVTEQLNDSRNSIKNLEKKLDRAMESRNELERDIAAISTEKDNLESELLILRENASDKETSEMMNNLREQLDTANRDRNDLEYDILNMRKELDSALEELSTRNDEFSFLRLERDKIAHENDELMEQLRSNNDESTERIELVQTEMNLLAQEHNALKEKTSREKIEISKLREKLMDSESERATLLNDLSNIKSQLETLKSGRKESENQSEIIVSLEKRVESLQFVEEELSKSVEKCQSLEFELTKLRGLEEEMSREKIEISKLRVNLEDSENKRATLQNNLSATMSQLEILNSDRKESEDQNEKIVTLEKQVESLKFVEEEFRKSVEKCKSLELELINLQGLEEETKSLRETCKALETQTFEGKTAETRLFEMEKKCNELETLLENLQIEKNEYQISIDENNRIIGELRDNLSNLESLLEKSNDNANMGKETIENLSRLVEEKDREIQIMKNMDRTKDENKRDEEENALAKLSAEREEFVRLVQEKHNTSLQYYAEIQRLAQLVNEQTTNLERVNVELEKKNSKLGEKDAELLWTQNELKVVRQRLAHLEESQNGETCGIVEHSLQIAQSTILNEKCKALEAALIKEQSSNRIMQNQLTVSQSRENNAAKELERLRTHLVEMEASYTEEALIAEENRKQLESRLLQAEEKAKNSSTVYTSASIRANQQVETLQQQMTLIVQQRDEIQNKLSLAEDKVLSHTASLTNLQFVLEQFQRDKESDIRTATEKIRQQLNMSYKDQEDLRNEIVNLRIQLSEAKECLQAASRLSEQLDKKSERIETLNQEVAILTELVNTADQRIQEATSNEEGKVDKNLVKNLLVGFLTSSTLDKSSVLRVFATVLDFDESEREKIGLNNPAANGGWFSGLLGSGGNATTKDQEASLSAAFVRFLESESKPKPQLPALTISNSSLSRPGHSRQHSSSSTQSGLLSSITLPSFPDFVPSRNTGSILKEVLKDS